MKSTPTLPEVLAQLPNEELALLLGSNVERFREAQGLSMTALGHMAGITRQTIASIECGDTRPGLNTIAALARALGVPAFALFLPPEAFSSPQPFELPGSVSKPDSY